MKLYIWGIIENLSRKYEFDYNLSKKGTLYEGLGKFIISRWRITVQTKAVENVKTDIIFSITFFKSRRLWDNVEKCGMARQAGTYDNITWRMHYARRITKATITHSVFVILIAFLHGNGEGATIRRYTYNAYLVEFYKWRSVKQPR
jgi:hypothetical protein